MTGADGSEAPLGLRCRDLAAAPQSVRRAARAFCLATIAEVYGTAYRPDWHSDLDGLAGEAGPGWFAPEERGAFWALHDASGEVVGTAGLYRLDLKPTLAAGFAGRYGAAEAVAQLVRVYLRADHRRSGVGRWLVDLAEGRARALGFATLYLHADSGTPATIAFWRSRGYRDFAAGEGSTHFDKPLAR
jgi:GNAT superfamily N-acetyltransferase